MIGRSILIQPIWSKPPEEEAVEDGILAQQTASAADVGDGDEDALIAEIEKKAKAIVGRWETTTVTDDLVAFEFGQPKAEGDTFVGTYTFFVNDRQEAPAKYVVTREDVIRFFSGGVEKQNAGSHGLGRRAIANLLSATRGIKSKMVRAGSRPKQQPAPAATQEAPNENLPQNKDDSASRRAA